MPDKAVTVPSVLESKGEKRLAAITAYDYPSGLMADSSGADIVLVGDSLAMVVLGHQDTMSVTMDEMIHHTRAASRGVKRALLVGDMPFGSYQSSPGQAVDNAARFLKEGRCQAVKLEGGAEMAPVVSAIVKAGIPVMGHVGLTPQRIAQLGGFKIQGKTADGARLLVDDARALAEAGCFSIVVECVPQEVGAAITRAVDVPVIGIGAGGHTDGQILVYHDVLGLFDRFTPKFVKRYAELGQASTDALAEYCREVREGVFPGTEHSTTLNPVERNALEQALGREDT